MAGVFDLELNDGNGDQDIDSDEEVAEGDAHHVEVSCQTSGYTKFVAEFNEISI